MGQLTVSDFSKAKFDERFAEMEKAKDVYLLCSEYGCATIRGPSLIFIIYYIVVCEDKKTNKLAAAGTVFVEKKFLRGGGLVCLMYLRLACLLTVIISAVT